MSDSGEIQNLGKTQSIPRHQSIGKNGSFWLPKDSSSQLRQPQTTSKSGKNGSIDPQTTQNSKNGSEKSNLNTNTSAKASFAKTIQSAEKKIAPKVPVSKNIISGTSSTLPSKGLLKSSVSQLPLASKGVKGLPTNTNSLLPSLVLKESVKPFVSSQLFHKTVSRDTGDQSHGKKNKQHGTKNAHFVNAMDSDIKDKLITTDSSSVNFSQSESSVVSKFVNFIGKSVYPRVAYVNKFSKKVVRFAIDLPSGSKLGVRLEKSEKGVSLCFIAPDEDTRALLDFCKKDIKVGVDADQSTQIQIHVFSDYKQMDNYFKRAA